MTLPDPQPAVPLELSYAPAEKVVPLLTVLQRTLLVVAVVLPLGGLSMIAIPMLLFFNPQHESYEIIAMLYHPAVAWPFYALLLYGVGSTLAVVIRPHNAMIETVRFGLWGGLSMIVNYVLIILSIFAAILYEVNGITGDETQRFIFIDIPSLMMLVAASGVLLFRVGSPVGINPLRYRLSFVAWAGVAIALFALACRLAFMSDYRWQPIRAAEQWLAVGVLIGAHLWPLLAFVALTALAQRLVRQGPPAPRTQRAGMLAGFAGALILAWGLAIVSGYAAWHYLPRQRFWP